jgi:hypothetical protein
MRARLVAVLALFAFALPVFGDPPMTSLQVEVRNLNDKPIERASVVVKFIKGRSAFKLGKKQITTWQLKTNQDGIAKLPAIPQGDIRVQVIAKGYQTFGETYEIEEAERTVLVRLNPPQPQYSSHQ